MKPIEFTIDDENKIIFFYEDGHTEIIYLPTEDGMEQGIPSGLERHKPYSITKIVDDKKNPDAENNDKAVKALEAFARISDRFDEYEEFIYDQPYCPDWESEYSYEDFSLVQEVLEQLKGDK